MNFHAIDLPQLFGQCRVDGVESPRHRADAITGVTSRRWRGASEIWISTLVRAADRTRERGLEGPRVRE